ncbi:iron-containing alcohol dehydrogenase [Verticiella sediminum]|uniref:Iron-containing alcohol dehydrogenase n=1 Tax=Verticiella sediminum TaxID=1247510 RepID=A0A556B202_9BURK|nr:iron-containing alcohol dehydrogenase family protein [Verticiella sediminum]TSH99199.1 iron-containing alcohol dehydrogenase [Verticiella sediminum]
MSSFQHLAPELRLHAGPDSLQALVRELDRNGCRRAAVIGSASAARPGGGFDLLRPVLGERLCGVFAQTRAHSPVDAVQEAVDFLAASRADAVVALGGGSVIVTARAASILLAEGQPAHALCSRREADGRWTSPRLQAPKLPQFVLPTTPTTACVKAGSALHDPASGRRLALFDPKTRARAIFLHPALLRGAQADVVRAAALNCLAMAVEGLESSRADPLSDASLMHAVRLLDEHLPARLDGDGQDAHREALMLAAVLCGRGTDIAGGGLASALGHAIGPRSHVPNGVVNAIVLPHTMAYNAPASGARLAKVAAALGERPRQGGDAATLAVGRLRQLLDRLPIARTLREVGLAREQVPAVATAAMQDWFLQYNPRPIDSAAQVQTVIEAAWGE